MCAGVLVRHRISPMAEASDACRLSKIQSCVRANLHVNEINFWTLASILLDKIVLERFPFVFPFFLLAFRAISLCTEWMLFGFPHLFLYFPLYLRGPAFSPPATFATSPVLVCIYVWVSHHFKNRRKFCLLHDSTTPDVERYIDMYVASYMYIYTTLCSICCHQQRRSSRKIAIYVSLVCSALLIKITTVLKQQALILTGIILFLFSFAFSSFFFSLHKMPSILISFVGSDGFILLRALLQLYILYF